MQTTHIAMNYESFHLIMETLTTTDYFFYNFHLHCISSYKDVFQNVQNRKRNKKKEEKQQIGYHYKWEKNWGQILGILVI